jgi:hypothetical protein
MSVYRPEYADDIDISLRALARDDLGVKFEPEIRAVN